MNKPYGHIIIQNGGKQEESLTRVQNMEVVIYSDNRWYLYWNKMMSHMVKDLYSYNTPAFSGNRNFSSFKNEVTP